MPESEKLCQNPVTSGYRRWILVVLFLILVRLAGILDEFDLSGRIQPFWLDPNQNNRHLGQIWSF
jgi:hypothetical protein